MFYRNQFRVLLDWFDFIHRCSFHSHWSCWATITRSWRYTWFWLSWSYARRFVVLGIQLSGNQSVILALDLHIHSIPFRSMIIGHSMLTLFLCLFQTPYHHSVVINLGSNHPLTLFHHFITTQIGLASMFQSFVWSMIRMKIRNLWEIKDPNWTNRVWFNVQNRNVLYLTILLFNNDWMKTIKWMNWIVLDSLIKSLYAELLSVSESLEIFPAFSLDIYVCWIIRSYGYPWV